MAFTTKVWQDSPSTTTPLSAAALADLESRLAAYTDLVAGALNVKSAGVTGNGTTDDTAAIQAAADALPAGGGVLFFPKGNYKVTSQITMPDGVHAWGAGRNISLILYDGTSPIDIFRYVNRSAFSVRRLGLRVSAQNVAINLLRLTDCVYYEISDVNLSASSPLAAGTNYNTGILVDQSVAGLVPPRGQGVFRNILYVVEPPTAGGGGSCGIQIKGHASQSLEQFVFEGEGNIEHAETAIKLENVVGVSIGAGWTLRGNSKRELHLVNASNVVVHATEFAPTPTASGGLAAIEIDANCYDTTIIAPRYNLSSGAANKLVDNGNRTNVLHTGDLDNRRTVSAPGGSSPAFATNFSNAPGTLAPVKCWRSINGELRIEGTARKTTNATADDVVLTLPVAMRPTFDHDVPVTLTTATTGLITRSLRVDTSGQVRLVGAPAEQITLLSLELCIRLS